MKYLKLYEAFESNIISKTVKYLTKKINKSASDDFLKKVKAINTKLDFPIDKIKDSDVIYLNRTKALKFKNEKDVDNTRGLYCFKFWFSMEDGYLGFTGTGNYTYEFTKKSSKISNDTFSDRELDYIKDELGIKTGKLEPVENYRLLKAGTKVIGFYSSDEDDLDKLALATIVIDSNGTLFAIQNVAGGGSPDDGTEWRQYGRFSWNMGQYEDPGSDHCKLHIYVEDETPLSIYKKDGSDESKEENPLNYNLPVSSNLNLNRWYNDDYSIYNPDIIDKADFAIILMVDNILSSDYKSVRSTRDERTQSKEGATKLKSDEEIKNENINRYITKIFSKMVDIDTSDVKDLQKIVIKAIDEDFCLFSILHNGNYSRIRDISNNLYKMIETPNLDGKKGYLENTFEVYKRINNSNNRWITLYKKSEGIIKSRENEDIKEIYNILKSISLKIYNYFKSQKIETVEDLKIAYFKIRSIRNVYEDDDNFSLDFTRRVFSSLDEPSDMLYYIDNIEEKKENYPDRYKKGIEGDLKSVKNLDRYIDTLLR